MTATKTTLEIPTRYQLYRHATHDASWGRAPIWLAERYFDFCAATNRDAAYIRAQPDAPRIPLIQSENQDPFHAWLLETYWPEAVNGVDHGTLSREAALYGTA